MSVSVLLQERVILALKETEGRDSGLLQATPTGCHDVKN